MEESLTTRFHRPLPLMHFRFDIKAHSVSAFRVSPRVDLARKGITSLTE